MQTVYLRRDTVDEMNSRVTRSATCPPIFIQLTCQDNS